MSVATIFRHERFLVLYKPEGESIHSEAGRGFVQRAMDELGQPLWPVHRLDKVTSGLLLVALDRPAAAELSQLFACRQVEKYYVALSNRRSRKKQGRVIGDMLPARNGSWKLATSRQEPAITDFVSAGLGNGLRAYLLKPATGRQHQLRVALKSQSAAILGDERYGGKAADRAYLHAWGLRFHCFGESFCIFTPPDSGVEFITDAFVHQLQAWQQPWRFFGSETNMAGVASQVGSSKGAGS